AGCFGSARASRGGAATANQGTISKFCERAAMKGDAASVAVIGGGVAGLVATYRLLQQGHRVHLFEAESSLGGLLRTFEIGGERIECFHQHLFTSDGAAVRLLDELMLLNTVKWRPTTAGVFYGDRI